MLRFRSVLFAVIAFSILSPRLWAWGCSGHEVVALIALQNLRKLDSANGTAVAQQVETLLTSQSHTYSGRFCEDFGLDPIAYFASWADDHRSVDSKTGPWHYWDIPLHVASATPDQFCDDGCVVKALQVQIPILQNKNGDPAARLNALMYVIHFIGDMHQPLHEEDNNDRGGNCVPVTFGTTLPKGSSNGNYSPNLHGVWDTQLVETVGKINRDSLAAKSQIEAFASSLQSKYASKIKQALNSPTDVVAWANETHALAIAYPYTKLTPAIAPAPDTAPIKSCSDNQTSQGYFDKHEIVDQAYVTAVRNTVKSQLAMAGGRLAAVLYGALK
jgi:hypothetical protein